MLTPDPADKVADGNFQAPIRRAGGGGLEFLVDYFTRKPFATAAGGEAGQLAAEVCRLRAELAAVLQATL